MRMMCYVSQSALAPDLFFKYLFRSLSGHYLPLSLNTVISVIATCLTLSLCLMLFFLELTFQSEPGLNVSAILPA